jgi:drug/metabolite transporter (DMT)-like permease
VLLSRAVDDVTRILQSEAHMLQTSMGAALETRLASAVATLTIVAVIVCGGVCVLCAGILLLHEWLPLWQSFGIAGAGILLIGIASYATMKSSARLKSAGT